MNRDLARDERGRVKPPAGVSSEGTIRTSASPLETGEDRRKAQGDERSSSSGLHIAQRGEVIAGPGL